MSARTSRPSRPYRVLIVGNGRVASHWGHYLSLIGAPASQWARATNSFADLQRLLSAATHVFLAISDRSLEPFIQEHVDALRGRVVLHASGALDLTSPARELGLSVHSTHPLFSFAPLNDEGRGQPPGHALDQYRRIPLVLDTDSPSLSELWPSLSNPEVRISRELRPMYHALCVLSGNGSALLWEKIFAMASEHLKLRPQTFQPYLESVFFNLRAGLLATGPKPVSALTGPWVRGDQGTIDKNRSALEQAGEAHALAAYKALSEWYAEGVAKK